MRTDELGGWAVEGLAALALAATLGLALAFAVALAGCAARAAGPPGCHAAASDVLRARRVVVRSTRFSPRRIAEQARLGGDVCFPRALDAAVAGLLGGDADGAAESPLAIAGAVPAVTPCAQPTARARLACYLRQRGSELGLVAGDDAGPEGGELVADAWIFYLWIPALSDHLYWAVVGRQAPSGVLDVEIQGFN